MNPVFGTTVGRRYALLNKLGEGGMGEVYRALDGLTRQVVAFKRVRLESDNPQSATITPSSETDGMRLALAQEFHTLASLRHPNIISVLDYGFDESRQPFFTMEYLEDAETLMQAGSEKPVETRINLLAQMLQAIAYLHRRGIIHRDLKPANVLVAHGLVRVLDFGLSQANDTMEDDSTSELAGTLAYMAPEVLRGETASEHADLYAIGVMAYELLAGRHPFDIANAGRLINDVLFTAPDITPLETISASVFTVSPDADTVVADLTIELSHETLDTTQKYGTQPFDLNKPISITPIQTQPQARSMAELVERLLAKLPTERYSSAETVLAQLVALFEDAIPAESAAIRESYLQAARFVGRSDELNELAGALVRATDGVGSAWLIAGESGVGKSRLLDELRTRALVSGFLVLRGQAVAEGGMPFQLWLEPLRRLSLSTELNDVDAGILKDIVPDIDLLQDRQIPEVAPVEGIAYQHRLLGTIANLFQKQQQPTLLVLEDLQWSKESLDVLKLLIGMTFDLPLLIVASYRDDERPDLPEILPGMQVLKLGRLTQEQIAALSVSMLGEAGRQPHILKFLREETEGNVFFLVEVVRALAEEAGSLDNIGRVSLPQSIVAGGIQTVIRRRLTRVPEWGLTLLQLAAVAGRELDLDILNAVKGAVNLEEWLTACANMAVLEVQNGEWHFSHDRLRKATLDMIPTQVRPSLHRQVAEAIERVYAGQPEKAVILAQHWRSAGDEAQELVYVQRAGEHALRVSAFADAIISLTRALELLDPTADAQRANILLNLGEALKYTGEFARAAERLESAVALRRHLNDQQGVAVALLELSDLIMHMGDYAVAKAHAEESLSIFQSLSQQEGIAHATDRVGLLLFQQGDYAAAARLSDEGLRISRAIGDQRGVASAVNNLGMYAYAQGNYPAAAGYFQESLAICRTNGERRKAAAALLNLGSVAGQQEDYDEAIRCFEESLAIFRSIGERRLTGLALDNLGVIAEFQGDYARSTHYYQESLAIAHAIGNRRGIATTLVNLGNLARAQGQLTDAAAYYHQAMQQAREIEAVPILLESLVGLAALEPEAVRALEWLGLVLNHPSTFEDTRKIATPIVDGLRDTMGDTLVEASLEHGKQLDLNAVVTAILG